jgi:hypothetical protein
MKEFSIPFSLYDFFAILLPGAVGVFGLYLFINPALTAAGHQAALGNTVLAGLTNQVALVTGLAVFSYLMGHLLNAFSELMIDRPANKVLGWSVSVYLRNLKLSTDNGLRWIGFSLRHPVPWGRLYKWTPLDQASPIGKLLKECVEEKFGPIFEDVSYCYTLVRAFVARAAPEVTGEAKIFIATAAMFQSLVLATALIGAALLRGMLAKQIGPTVFWPSIGLTVVLTSMFFFSYRRYKRLWVETLYAGFIANAKGK